MVNNTALDLQVINETFGENADLYEDVLRVPTTATQEEIQLAYFDRRSELFTLLAKIDAAMKDPQSESSSSMMIDQRRYKAERQMDSVVFAVRILADPTLRISYDEIRPERVGIVQLGYPLKQTQSAVTTESSSVVSRTSSVLSSTVNNGDNNNSNRSQPKQKQQHHQREQSPTQQNQQEWPPRVVTPTELPANSSTVSESKSWVKSAYGSLLSVGNNSRTDYDDNINDDDDDNDTEIDQENFEENIYTYNNNPRKQKRRQKQQQPSPSTSPTRPTEHDLGGNPAMVEKEKKSLWGRKKRKKKRQSKHQNGVPSNQSIDSNVTDKSMTDNKEDIHDNNKVGDRDISTRTCSTSKREGRGVSNNIKKSISIQRSTTSHTEHTTGTGEESEVDDDTRTFLDDDGDTFATLSVFSNDDDEKLQKKANKCGKQGMFGCITGSKTFQKISDEISGACEDTLISVDQVFNAFTLTDKDIKAVTKKIGKAKRQLET